MVMLLINTTAIITIVTIMMIVVDTDTNDSKNINDKVMIHSSLHPSKPTFALTVNENGRPIPQIFSGLLLLRCGEFLADLVSCSYHLVVAIGRWRRFAMAASYLANRVGRFFLLCRYADSLKETVSSGRRRKLE